MRGDRLINSLFPEYEAEQAAKEKSRAGRKDFLIQLRNERLCARVYYLRAIKRMRNEDIMKQISLEFDLSVSTISELLQEEQWQDYLINLRGMKPGRKWFKVKWGWMVW